MPLVGLIDECGQAFNWDEIKAGKGLFSDPMPILLAFYRDRDSYCDFSITELISDPYQLQLKRRYAYYEEPSEQDDRIQGSAIHAYMEKLGVSGNAISEQTLTCEFKVGAKSYKIGGTPDLVLLPVIWDYKTVTVGKLSWLLQGIAASSVKAYTEQLSAYRLLLHKHRIGPVKTAKIRFWVRDWRSSEFKRKGSSLKLYPRSVVWSVPLMSLQATEEWLLERLQLHIKAARMLGMRLHTIGECDTWGGKRCAEYCSVSGACWFRNNSH